MKFSQANISSSVPIKQLNASATEQTIGSPLILNDVLTSIGHFVNDLNFSNKS